MPSIIKHDEKDRDSICDIFMPLQSNNKESLTTAKPDRVRSRLEAAGIDATVQHCECHN